MEAAWRKDRLRICGVLLALVASVAMPVPSRSVEQERSAGSGPGESILPEDAWQNPPLNVRPIARWWWPGGSVEPGPLRQHAEQIARAGFGGVEVQPLLLGLGADDLSADANLRTVGRSAFFARVAAAEQAAHQLGLRFDLTLGSGWPGGLPIPASASERQLLMAVQSVSGPSQHPGSLPVAPDQSYRSSVEWVLDVLGPPDPEIRRVAILAAPVLGRRDGIPVLGPALDLSANLKAERLEWRVPEGDWKVFVLYANSTGHFVMGGAYPGQEAEALVVDHLSRRGADALLTGYGDRAVKAVAPGRLDGIFVDSFELMGELPYTKDFARAFRDRVGYDLTPHLPILFIRGGESKYAEMMDFWGRTGGPRFAYANPEEGARIREDYEAVRQALFEEAFIGRFVAWSNAHKLTLRLQAHGGYGDYLDTYALADIPESEGLFGGGSFDFMKLASSAAHVAGHRWASSEAFITLRLYGRHLSDLEMRLLAGRAYSAGINQLVFHGVPYPYRRADGAAWYPFSGGFGRILAGPLPMSSDLNVEKLGTLSPLTEFLGRLSLAMSQGKPATDVAWLNAEPHYPDVASLEWGRVDPREGESAVTAILRARGLTYDRVSRRMLAKARPLTGGRFQIGAQVYQALLLDSVPAANQPLVDAVGSLVKSGTPVMGLGALPTRALGWKDAELRDRRVRQAVGAWAGQVTRVDPTKNLEHVLQREVRPALFGPQSGERFGFSMERRTTPAGDLALIFNESWSPVDAALTLQRSGTKLMVWDPATGNRRILAERPRKGQEFTIELKPAESLIVSLGQDDEIQQSQSRKVVQPKESLQRP